MGGRPGGRALEPPRAARPERRNNAAHRGLERLAFRGARRLPSCRLRFPAARRRRARRLAARPSAPPRPAPLRPLPPPRPGRDPPLSAGGARGPRLGGGQFPPALRARLGARSERTRRRTRQPSACARGPGGRRAELRGCARPCSRRRPRSGRPAPCGGSRVPRSPLSAGQSRGVRAEVGARSGGG